MALSSDRSRYAGQSVCNRFGHPIGHPLVDALRSHQRDLSYLRVIAPVEYHQQRVFQTPDVRLLYGADGSVDLRKRVVRLFQLRDLAFLRMSPIHQSAVPIPKDFNQFRKLCVLRLLPLIRRFVMSSCDSVVIAQSVASIRRPPNQREFWA